MGGRMPIGMSITEVIELNALRRSGHVVAEALRAMEAAVAPGVTTAELDHIAERIFQHYGAISAPRRFYNFPGSTCISLNEEAVHGIPRGRKIRRGDLVKLDVTVDLEGWIADAATTVLVEPVRPVARRLAQCSREALTEALKFATIGQPIFAIGRCVQNHVEKAGFRVLRMLCGHGVGRSIHEEPVVPNFYDPVYDTVLQDGMVLTIEPIIAVSTEHIVKLEDGWTLITQDRSLSAHFEHTLCITPDGPQILTAI